MSSKLPEPEIIEAPPKQESFGIKLLRGAVKAAPYVAAYLAAREKNKRKPPLTQQEKIDECIAFLDECKAQKEKP